MAYHGIDDLLVKVRRETLVNLTDDVSVGDVDMAIIDGVGESAAAVIDGYLGGRYAVPFSVVPNIVRECSVALAVRGLYCRAMPDAIPEEIIKKYDATIQVLEHIRDGKIDIGVTGAQSTIVTNKTADDRLLTKERLDAFTGL